MKVEKDREMQFKKELKESVNKPSNFETIDKVIRTYIKHCCCEKFI